MTSDFLYGTLSKDTFWQGKVLGHKFRLLRISYTIFLYGIIVSVLAFMTAIIFFLINYMLRAYPLACCPALQFFDQATGNFIINSVPSPSLVSTFSSPPCAFTIS